MIINKKVVPILTPITNLATPKMLKDAKVKEVEDKKQLVAYSNPLNLSPRWVTAGLTTSRP